METIVMAYKAGATCYQHEVRIFATREAAQAWADSQWPAVNCRHELGNGRTNLIISRPDDCEEDDDYDGTVARIEPATLRGLFPRLDRKNGQTILVR